MRFPSRLPPTQRRKAGQEYVGPRGYAWTAGAAGVAGLIVAVPVADLYLPPDIHIAHVLVVPIAFVAAFAGARLAALTALLAMLSLLTAALERHTLTTENVLVQMSSLLLLSVVLVLVSRRRERHRREAARLRRVSEAAQQVVLRPLPRRAGEVSIASAYRAAEACAGVGGDLYAVARTSDATRLLIGDVRGKGLGSIGDTETVLGAFRAAAHRQSPLPELMASLEASVRWGLAESSALDTDPESDVGERFVTAAVVEIPDGEPWVHVVNCGHLPPLLLHDGAVTALDVADPAPPLGLGGLADSSYATTTFSFAPGDRLLLYTDGVTEARDPGGSFYPLQERIPAWADFSPESLVRAMTDDLLAHVAAPLGDDMAVIALEREELRPSVETPRIEGVPGQLRASRTGMV
ncbi:PP2C family protein-serine/threonine phosphatase [Streptacidiphilus griseoplanus]|uniref:PP2C family protein-serine/threonine phosphatase n=1 Tax=Peterkaempfera griseoplana TaxID=66896 RepID=UPI00099E6F66|nr:PP2C family protein-serine/threonine phosphatase [Peterkaempfera griseoplana]BCN13470.1 stage II sporulation protein E [Peterkaempfera griseoplana]